MSWSSEIHYLTAFIAAEHLRRLTIVATDIGGLFGFAYAERHPHNVTGIALWETVTAPIPSYHLLGSYCPAQLLPGVRRLLHDPEGPGARAGVHHRQS